MNHCFVNNLCISSISSYCDQRCGYDIHIPPHLPIYDGHIHLNQVVSKIEADFISAKVFPSTREYHFINNNHKPNEWLVPNLSTFSSNVHIYPTIGIHPKYFNSQSIFQNLNDLNNHLEISHTHSNFKNKIVALGECGLDETAITTIDHQIFVLQNQIDLANHFHLPIVLHCRGFHLYQTLFDCLKSRISDKYVPLHWHCINTNSNLDIIDLFLNHFPNSYIGLNGSITYTTNPHNSIKFQNWLVNRAPFLPNRLIFETDYPYLPPQNLKGTYDPTCALIATAKYLSNTTNDPNQNIFSYIHSSNINIKTMYGLHT
jgi:TatD DNase family protein